MEPYTLPLCNPLFSDKADLPQEFEITLPEYLPGIGKIVRADADTYALSSSLADGSLTVTGKYSVRLLYNDEKSGYLKCAVFPRDFSYTFDASAIPAPLGTPTIEENACILSVSVKPKGPRAVGISLGLALKVTVYDCGETKLLSPDNAEVELHAENTTCAVRKLLKSDSIDLQEDITLDGSMAPIADIADYTADFRLDDITCGDEVVRYRGNVLFKCAYRAENSTENTDAEYVYLTKELPFDGEIPCPDAQHGMNVIGRICPEEMQVSSSFDAYGENRVIHASLGCKIWADLFDEVPVTYFDDGFCSAYECDFEKSVYTYDTVEQTVKEHTRFEQSLRADREGFTEIADAGIRLDALTPEIIDGKPVMSGRGVVWVTGANKKAETVGTSLPVNVRLPLDSLRDASPEKRYVINAEIRDCRAVLRDGEIVFSCEVALNGVCLGREKITAIHETDVHYDKPKPICRAEYIVCYPEPQENLWSIAKKYEIPREALRNANGLTGDALPQGKRTVVIPCGESAASGA